MASRLLHGTLDVTIFEVEYLPKEFKDEDLFVTIDIEATTIGRTKQLQQKTSKLSWNDTLHLYCAHIASNIIFSIKHTNIIQETVIESSSLPTSEVIDGKEVETWLDGKSHGCKLHVKVLYSDVTKCTSWDNGMAHLPEFPGVPFTYFPQREGCKVTLYQDAHVLDNFAPMITLDKGIKYSQNRCWEDIFNAINEAKHFIYITGWSIYTPITLLRDDKRPNGVGEDISLGELLKKKAEEGVRVLILIWSTERFLELDFLGTHDRETEAYFKGTKVHCVRCLRDADAGDTFFDKLKSNFVFAHHQKTVVVDRAVIETSSERQQLDKRSIVSFIGGIDLCDGRYDTQLHSLFQTLDSTHRHDFYQNCFKDASIECGGPREPWHDIHCQLEGPIAWDVLENFEQRWKKQGLGEELLLNVREKDSPFVPPSPIIFPDNDYESTWNVQLFRSVDEGAILASFPKGQTEMGLFNGKKYLIERSIQDSYINAIRRAKKFIYIENQYFLGSSFSWINDWASDEATHLIPKELSLKIVSKIEKEERFSVYIVIPMWPEGHPDSSPMQDMLHYQRQTMDMMYTDVVKALKKKGITADPKDYLSFFCLGNREKKKNKEYQPSKEPKHGTDYWKAQQARRFMIYVHSKMMIVDDEYIIVGSANLNQRSMDGARDTEIAMGAFQPHHIAKDERPARGQVHGFRMSLWYEHLGLLDDTFLTPESLECIRKVNQLAQKNWNLYTQGTARVDLPGHLLCYPIKVGEDGQLMNIYKHENFPDTDAKIFGQKSLFIPSVITKTKMVDNEGTESN